MSACHAWTQQISSCLRSLFLKPHKGDSRITVNMYVCQLLNRFHPLCLQYPRALLMNILEPLASKGANGLKRGLSA